MLEELCVADGMCEKCLSCKHCVIERIPSIGERIFCGIYENENKNKEMCYEEK